jgi:hypothetical protein
VFQSDCLWMPQAAARAYVLVYVYDQLTRGDHPSFCQEFALTHRAKALIPPYPSSLTIDKLVHVVEGQS